jgi:hypothetical protein
MPKVRFRAA